MRLPTYFISHGGGPWPWMPDWHQKFRKLEAALAAIPSELPYAPKAVLVISGHWTTQNCTVMSSPQPPMVYDYYGFPKETYDVVYPAPGAPEFAELTAQLIRAAGYEAHLDDARGYDHGAFVPLYVMYPQADVPTYQLSLMAGYDPEAHIAVGRAIAALRDEGVLIIGSGLSYHNLSLFNASARTPSEAFDQWLHDSLSSPPDMRTKAMIDWTQAPYARLCHPNEDHLVPLFCALGAAENDVARRVYHEDGVFGGVSVSNYRFG